ncbi:Protein transport protein SEC16A-like protein [Bienertia sinuspersici]
MASNPPFELEDQTDEDFFDKLVNDDDDDVGSSVIGLNKADDISDGNVSDEVKTFANLSISETSSGNSCLEPKEEKENNDNQRTWSVEAREEPIVEAREEQVVVGETNSTSITSVSSDMPVLDNGPVSEDGVTDSEVNSGLRRESSCSSASGVKEVQWSAFTESALQGINGVRSFDDFFTDLGEEDMGSLQTEAKALPVNETSKNAEVQSLFNHVQYQGTTGDFIEQTPTVGDTYSIEYWESLYPGWKYDPNTAQWYQLFASDGTVNGQESFGVAAGNIQGNFDPSGNSLWATSDVQSSQVFNAQQMAQPANSQYSAAENVYGWNYLLHQNGDYQYPAHMIFDPQYPGWYYDTIAQGWCSLEAYHALVESTDQTFNQQAQNGFLSPAGHSHTSSQGINIYGQQGPSSEGLKNNAATSFADYGHQAPNAPFGMVNRSIANPSVVQSSENSSEFNICANQMSRQIPFDLTGAIATYEKTSQSNNNSNWASGLDSSPAGSDFQLFNYAQQVQQNGPAQYPADYYNNQQAAFSQPSFSNGHHISSSPSEGRSSAGRPPHALVTFGFGGKLLVMRDNNTGGFSTLGSKNDDGSFLSVYNLMEVVSLNNDPHRVNTGVHNYFHSLCHQSFPGPLVGGNVGSKELNKWIDERIASCEPVEMNSGKGQGPKLLLSLLKVACQHYGKFRSFGSDTGLKENDHPESAVAKLFAAAKRNDNQFGHHNAISKCLMTLPSEAHTQTTATEVQNLLISGRKVEALQRAQEGQFWGFALILSRELGEQFYADTVKQMAVSQLAVGSPLRTLCLLIAKKPEEVFSNSVMPSSNVYGAAAHMSPHPVQSGYVANLAPAKIVGKLLNFFDSTAHRVVGGLPPPVPSSSATQSSFQGNDNQFQTPGPKVAGSQSTMGASSLPPSASMNLTSSQSTMGMSSLIPSASMEPISQWAVDESKMTLQNRSVSEPDIGRTPRPNQADNSNEPTSSSTTGKQSGSTGTSRFGRFNFGAQILQKTVGLVLKPRQGRQAKLGDANKFYYDEKLKRWVEEGAEPPPEESALPPPPPTTATFQNGKSDYNLKHALNDGLHATDSSPGSNSTPESSPSIPPALPSSNQFSARGRMGVRSRYVDTFNKGGGTSTNLFQAPSVPSAKPASLNSAKFFVPTAVPTNDQTLATDAGSRDEVSESEISSVSSMNDPLQNLAPSPVGTMQRFPSVGNIPSKSTTENGKNSLSSQSRRAASWSAIQSDTYSRPPTSEIKASPLSFMPSNHLPGSLHMDSHNSGDDLQEVEL